MAVQPSPKRLVHLDFHTMPDAFDVGRDFNAEEFAQTLAHAGVDYITVFARCNIGFAYYPTKIGIIHPSLQRDLLGEMVSACHKRDIRVAAYFNAGIDHEHALRHRDWVKVNKEGQVYRYQQMGHFFRNMCLNTGYRHHLYSMIAEVLAAYAVDGIFLDCFNMAPCYGIECLDEMKARHMDVFSDAQVQEFTRLNTYRFCDDVVQLVERERPGINLFFNGLPYRRQPTHIEMEVLPTGGWGYDYLPLAIRFARNLGKPFLTMTGRFHKSWGDFGGLRPLHSLLFDCFTSIANGGACGVGDHMHPRGQLEPAVYNLIGTVFAKVKELESWADGARALTDMAILDPAIADFPRSAPLQSTQGATRLLSELNFQFDVVDNGRDLDKYKVVILPDHVAITDELQVQLRRFLSGGGYLISSAFSGLDPDKKGFALPDYKLKYEGPEPYNYTFFIPQEGVKDDLPEMATTIYNPGIAMTVAGDAEILARLYKPYFNLKSWDYEHENLYIPPDEDAGRPAVVRCGNIIHFAFPVFAGYFEHAVPAYKYLVRNCIRKVLPNPVVKVSDLPSFGKVTVTYVGQIRIVHILTYVPELRGKMQVIEDPTTADDVHISLRLDGNAVKSVYLAPTREHLDHRTIDGYICTTVPKVNGYQMVVFE